MKFFQKLSRKKLNPNSSSSKLRHVNTIDEISSFGSLISPSRDNQRQKQKQKQPPPSIPSPHIPDIIDLNTVPMSEIYYNSLTSLIEFQPDQSFTYSSLQTNNDTKYCKRPSTESQSHTKRQYDKEGIKFQQHKGDLKLLSPLYTHSYVLWMILNIWIWIWLITYTIYFYKKLAYAIIVYSFPISYLK